MQRVFSELTRFFNIVVTPLIIIVLGITACDITIGNISTPTLEDANLIPASTVPQKELFPITIPADLQRNTAIHCNFDSFAYDQGWVVTYCSNGTGNQTGYALYIEQLGSTSWTRILSSEVFQYIPAASFSPDESLLAITDGGGNRLLIVNTDIWQIEQVIDLHYANGDPIWSPDGRKIAMFTANRYGDEPIIEVISLDGSINPVLSGNDLFPGEKKPEEFMVLPYPFFGPTWSPDGKKLAFLAYTNSFTWKGDQLWQIDIDSGEKELLLSGDIGNYPVWSPDGGKIALINQNNMNNQSQNKVSLVVFYLSEKKMETILEVVGASGYSLIDSKPYWSPDNEYIAIQEFTGNDSSGLYVVSVETGLVEKLKDGLYYPTPIQWTPDGKSIVVHEDQYPNSDELIDIVDFR